MCKLGADTEIDSQPTTLWGGSTWNIHAQGINTRLSGLGLDKNRVTYFGEYYAKNGTEVGPPINIQFNVTLTREDYNLLNVRGSFTGNIFPAQESLIFDEAGNGLFLGTSIAEGGPITNVWGEGRDNTLYTFNFNVVTSDDGKEFLGVLEKDANGCDIVISLDEWNSRQTSKHVWDEQEGRQDYEE